MAPMKAKFINVCRHTPYLLSAEEAARMPWGALGNRDSCAERRECGFRGMVTR
jgi:hypothetical protein